MAESKLDVIIDPKRAMEGARQVQQALNRIGTKAAEVTSSLHSKFTNAKNAAFSFQSALAAAGVGALAKSLIDVSRQLDIAERGLRTVTPSLGAAAIQMERIRKLADEFQLGDLPMANAFRLLASHDIPDTERALRTLANTAVNLGEDLDSVLTGVLAGNERALRRLGVQLIDLGQGQVDLAFGNMEVRVQKTDQAIRAGLLQLFEKGLPDATKQMGTSIDFQLKRMSDGWEDFRVLVMKSGLEDFLTQTFKKLNDGLDENEMKRKAKVVSDAIVGTIKTIALNVAFVIDLVKPIANIVGEILGDAIAMFNRLPVPIQTLGIFGAFFFGLKGAAVMIAGLALVEKLNQAADRAGQSDAGSLEGKFGNLMKSLGFGTGGAQEKTLLKLDEMTKRDTDSALNTTRKFFADVDRESTQSAQRREQARASAEGGAVGGRRAVDANTRVVEARIAQLKKDTAEFVRMEELKRGLNFNPDAAEAAGKALEYVNALQKEGLTITKQQKAAIEELFKMQGDAVTRTRASAFLSGAEDELQEMKDMTVELRVQIGDRERVTALHKAERDLVKEKLTLTEAEKGALIVKIGLMDQERKTQQGLLLMQEQSSALAAETARLRDETADISGGTRGVPIGSFPGAVGVSVPSRETLLNQRQREFELKGIADQFDRLKVAQEVDIHLMERRQNFIARSNFEMNQQIALGDIELSQTGKMVDEREREIRVRQALLDLQQKGVELTEEEVEKLKAQSDAIQKNMAQMRTADAINRFVDNFRVGWDTIVKMGEQAYSHLEDALTQWIMKGKLDFTSFVNFVTQEFIRMGIRASIGQLLGAGSSSSAGGGLLGQIAPMVVSGIGALAGGGGGAAWTQLFSGNSGAAGAAMRGISNPKLFGPGFQRGGVFDYYSLPGAQRGMVSSNERLLRISEGHTPEAVVPLSGGRNIPVKMMGGGGATVHAPITIITPDAAGVRRSETQIQAQLSVAMGRASRRIN